jgi:two-component system response regulator HydG
MGLVLAHEGELEEALAALARCEEMLAELGEKFERARTLLHRGRMLKGAGATGEANESFERARQIFLEMELPNWVAQVDEAVLGQDIVTAPHIAGGTPSATPDRFGIITRDPRMLALWRDLTRAAQTKLPVLIEGESGTGKELFAQAVHQLSPRQGKEFVPINCGAIPHDMQESELFGHARGSFTGSVDDRPGLFETAHNGTLFLDEIGEMAATAQVKLLRAIETGQVRRIGDRAQRNVDVRYVAATNVGILAAVAAGRFREDLFHRLDGYSLTIPPLRERRSDIPLLVDFFVARAARENDRDVHVGPALMNRLMAYDWRGNVRELRNKVTRAVMLASRAGELSAADFPFLLTAGAPAPALDRDLDQIERARIIKVLEENNWSKSAAARILNVQRTTLHSRMERLGIPIRKPSGPPRSH